MLDKSPHGVVPLEDPIYQDPVDLASPRVKSCITPHGVSLDEEGYAIPDTMRHTMGRRQVSDWVSCKQRHVCPCCSPSHWLLEISIDL